MDHDNQREIDELKNKAEQLRASENFFAGSRRVSTISPTARLERVVPQVGFKRLSESAVIPTKAHASDSGFDLVASEDVAIFPDETKIIPTGIAVQLPEGYEAQVRPRSGVTSKSKLRIQLGTIDQSYRGEIGIIVDSIAINTKERQGVGVDMSYPLRHIDGTESRLKRMNNNAIYMVRKGDRLAQLVIQPLPTVEAIEVFDVEETERGTNGYGSSGVGSVE